MGVMYRIGVAGIYFPQSDGAYPCEAGCAKAQGRPASVRSTREGLGLKPHLIYEKNLH